MDTVIGFNSLDFDNDGKISSKDVRNWRKMQNFDWILD
jgi:Ca2+-binding EF-hand superfamily protein